MKMLLQSEYALAKHEATKFQFVDNHGVQREESLSACCKVQIKINQQPNGSGFA